MSGRRLLGGYAILAYVFLYAPIAVVVVFAFNGGRDMLVLAGFSTQWFESRAPDAEITGALKLSILIALGNALVACVLGTMLALALPRMRPWAADSARCACVHDPGHARDRLRDRGARLLRPSGPRVGLDSPLGWHTILIAHVVFNTSVVALVVRARFVSMGQQLEEASFDLGAGPLSTFRQVTLPRLAPAILAGGLLAFTFSFDDFITSFFVTGTESETLPIYIWGQLRFGVTPAINATAAMMLALTLVVVVVAYLVLRRSGQERDGTGVPGV